MRSLPVFPAICLAMGAATVALSMLGTLVPLFAVDLGLAATSVGVLVALPNVFPVVLAITAGRLVDRLGPTRWLLVGTTGATLGPMLVWALPGVVAVAAAQLLVGLSQLFTTLSAQSLVADVANGRSVTRNFSLFTTTLSAGRMVGPVVAGLVVDLAGFRTAFGVAALTLAVPVVIAWGLRRSVVGEAANRPQAVLASTPTDAVDAAGEPDAPTAGPSADDAGAPERATRSRGAGLANVGVQLAVLASAGVFVAVSVRQAFLPVLLTDLGYSATAIGLLISVGSLAAVLVRPLMPGFTRVLGGPARTLVVAMSAVAVGVGALGWVTAWGAFAALAVVVGFGTGIGLPLSIVTVASHVDPRQRGAALGLRLSLNRAAQLAMPVAVGALVTAAGFGVAFATTGAVLAALAILAARRVTAFERTAPLR
jgi:MFS family permease